MTIYYDAYINGLIPVRNCYRKNSRTVVATVARTKNGYKAGETIKDFAHHFVVKARVKDGHQLVKTAVID